ncbi:MAG: rhodanese-like domain-containing protein [Bdellovibrionota bacterium]
MTQKTVDQSIVNLSGYLFTKLEPEKIQEKIKLKGEELGIRGTILLSVEGINCFFAGTDETTQALAEYLFSSEIGIPPFELKKSFSDYIPFRRFLVKIKKEIISTGREDLDPNFDQAPYISAKELKDWYDQNKDFVVLDTRNDYEIKLGKFKDAKDLNVTTFKKFIAKTEELPEEWKSKPVVTYCTGGIRCEKAALHLKKKGFKEVKQLHGGILKYFEECGNNHYEGECFVFDKRIGVDANLLETETTQCYACRAPLVPQDLRSDYYFYGESCPYCKKKKSNGE